ncbi:MAG: hypothetical protein ABIP61_15220, partial [Burkholderiaceae bacterium]
VQRVLVEIGAGGIPHVLVFNKLDRLEESQRPRALRDCIEQDGARIPRVFVSATSGEGLALLRGVLADAAAGRLDELALNRADPSSNAPTVQGEELDRPVGDATAPASTGTPSSHA